MSVKLTSIYENESLKSIFAQAIENNKLLHAVILEGADGTGKMTFAKELASALCCVSENKPCGLCEPCRKISEEIAVDVSYYDIPNGKSEITVETIRNIREDTYKLPCETECKVYIINNAQAMNTNAQNAFLKILEEPPSYVYFFLLCTNSSLLLPTVRSRAPVFRMQTLDVGTMRDILKVNSDTAEFADKYPDAFEHILQFSDGSLGYCIARCMADDSSDDVRLYDDADRFINLLINKNRVDLALFGLGMTSDRKELGKFLSLVRSGLRDLIIAKKTDRYYRLFFANDNELPEKAVFSNPTWLNTALIYTENALKQNNSNCNINIIKTDYISKIGALCRR